MKIFIVGDFAYPEGGAALSRLLHVAAALVEAGHKVQLAAMSGAAPGATFKLVDTLASGRIDIHAWSTGRVVASALGIWRGIAWFLRIYRGAKVVHDWLKLEAGLGPDNVLFVYGRSYVRLAPLVKIAKRKGAFVALDVTEGIERFRGFGGHVNPVYWDWWLGLRLLPGQVDLVTPISQGLAERCVIAGAKRVVVLPGIESWERRPDTSVAVAAREGPFRLFVFAALNIKDAPALLMEVALELKRRDAPVRLEVVGRYMSDSEGQVWALRLAALPGIFPWLRFHGAPLREQLEKLLGEADGFLMLRSDNAAERLAFPTRLIEILKYARPVLVSDVGDVAFYLQDNEHAVLLPTRDGRLIVDRIVELVSRPDRGRSLGEAGRLQAAECFDRARQMAVVLRAISDARAGAGEMGHKPKAIRPFVAILVNSLGGGGAEKQMLLSARLLAEAGYDCRLYVMSSDEPHRRIEHLLVAAREAGVTVIRVIGRFRFSLRVIRRFWADLLEKDRPLVWSWGYRADVVRHLSTWVVPGLRSVVSLRSAYEEEINTFASLWHWFDGEEPIYLSNSRRNLEQLGRHLPAIRRRSKVLYNALESEAHQISADLPVVPPKRLEILMLGNVRLLIKGYDHAIELAARLKARGVCFRLRIGGALHEGEGLKRLIEQHGVEDMVQLEGVIHRPLAFLQTGHVFLLLSRVEGMPNALMEAMSLGLPCISTMVGDVQDFSRSGTALKVVPIGDVPAVEAQIVAWLADWKDARATGREAAKLCRELFTTDQLDRTQRRIFGDLTAVAAPQVF